MELLEHKNFSHFSKPNSFKLVITKFFASLFFFAAIFFSSSSLLPLMFNLVEFFSSNVGKNYRFLLCNGIIFLIVKNSGLINRSHQESNPYGHDGETAQKVVGLSDKKAVDAGEKVDHMKVEEVQLEVEDKSLIIVGAGGDQNIALITQDEEGQQEYDQIGFLDEEEEEDEANGLLSAEEFNRKCDDFIRRMKDGIKFEAHQQLIMVQY